jgi:hypothetical protein
MQQYKSYFNSVKHLLGDHLTTEIEKTVGRVISNIAHIGAHYFRYIATMGYISSSIVEGSNVGIKRGVHAVKATMNIDMAGSQMLQQVNVHSHKRNMEFAKSLHCHNQWSCSLTKDTLTTYMEGLAVKNYDMRDTYVMAQYSENCWLVLHKTSFDNITIGNNQTQSQSIVTEFHRVRKVCISPEGYMSCTCPYSYQYLAPCRHMMVVLGSNEKVTCHLFHLRWWKAFNYYYLTDFGQSLVTDIHTALEKALLQCRNTQFSSNGYYKGCHLIDTTEMSSNTDTNTAESDTIKKISNFSDMNGFIKKGCGKCGRYITSMNNIDDSNNINFSGMNDDLVFIDSTDSLVDTFGGLF